MNSSTVTITRLPHFVKEKKLREKDIPLAMNLEVTARCNNDCRHCYVNLPASDQVAYSRELSLSEIERIADEAVDMGTLWCLLSGGEPLLRQDFAELYQMLVKKGLLVSLYTNGTLITNDHVQLFRAYPPRSIEITVYGVTPETYRQVTGRGNTFSHFQRGLQLLLDNNIPVRLKTMAIRSNVAELPKIAEFCRQWTKGLFRFDPFLHLRTDGNQDRNRLIESERLSPNEIGKIEHLDPDRSASLIRNCQLYIQDAASQTEVSERLFRCNLGSDSFSVSYDGKFRVCHSLCEPSCCYDLREGSLAQAWHQFRHEVRALRVRNKQVAVKCKGCAIANLCFWCPANAHLESGNLESWSDYFCDVAHARARALQEQITIQNNL